jgi:hypothetical protein
MFKGLGEVTKFLNKWNTCLSFEPFDYELTPWHTSEFTAWWTPYFASLELDSKDEDFSN